MKPRILILILGALALAAGGAEGATTCAVGAVGATPVIHLSWVPPTIDADGVTPLALPLTYNVYLGTAAGNESGTPILTGLATPPQDVTAGLVAGTTYYVVIETVDAHGVSSGRSNEVCKSFPFGVPGAPVVSISGLLPGQLSTLTADLDT